MRIKNFGLEAPREHAVMMRILGDIERRFPLPELNLVYNPAGLHVPNGTPTPRPLPCLTAIVNETEAFHCAVVDLDPSAEELTMLMTHTHGSAVGFKTTYQFKPQGAVFISFDILRFFYERVATLAGCDDEGVPHPNPVYQKTLEVEKLLKPAYSELPESYTWILNTKAAQTDDAPSVTWKA